VLDASTGRAIGSSRYHGDLKRLMLRHAFRFVDTVAFYVAPQNARSRRALEKIGGVLQPEPDAQGRVVYRIRAADFRRLRPAQAADADAIALVHTRSWRESYRGSFSDAFLDGELPEERIRVWRARLADPPASQLVLLAHEAGQLVGFACACGAHDPRWGSLVDNLHVVREAKRGGIGAALMQETGAWLERAHAGQPVYLLVLEANAAARRFYERIGGRNAGVSTMETHGGAIVRSCRYAWPSPAALRSGSTGRSA
jgi:RimJ/RimL family protein N-acetyltransferase